jgi:hypothetical protein
MSEAACRIRAICRRTAPGGESDPSGKDRPRIPDPVFRTNLRHPAVTGPLLFQEICDLHPDYGADIILLFSPYDSPGCQKPLYQTKRIQQYP